MGEFVLLAKQFLGQAAVEASAKLQVVAALVKRALEDFHVQPKRAADIDPQAPQVELELAVLAALVCCAVHAQLARRFRPFFAALPFVLICNALLSAADSRVPAEIQASSVYSTAGFTLLYKKTPFYVRHPPSCPPLSPLFVSVCLSLPRTHQLSRTKSSSRVKTESRTEHKPRSSLLDRCSLHEAR